MTVKTKEIKNKISESTKILKISSKRILRENDGGTLRHAATICQKLCSQAKVSLKRISYFASLTSEKETSVALTLAYDMTEAKTDISEKGICAFLRERGEKYGSATLFVLSDMIFIVMFKRIADLVHKGKEEDLAYLLHGTERLRFIDFSRIFFAFSATEELFSREKAGYYAHCDRKTKFMYIAELLDICKKEGKSESEKARELLALANEREVHIGTLILKRRASVGRIYVLCLISLTALFSVLYLLLSGFDTMSFIILPAVSVAVYGAVKQLLSLCFKFAGNEALPRLSGHIVKEEKAIIAIMSILCGGKSDEKLFERIENFYLADENPNRLYAIVCNLPDAKKRREKGDDEIIAASKARIDALNAKYGAHFGIFIRSRRYSNSERKYIGKERKRGAVLELCRAARGKATSICDYIADEELLQSAKYLITLDSDTNLYAGASDELIGTMLHPMNAPIFENGIVVSGHAIVQPHIGATLESAAGTEFALITAGNGGIDAYASASFDIYENVFENGTFCGKGILDIDAFLKACDGFFPEERILSHDILEGNLLGSAIAGDITLTDDTPQTALSYFMREHRWIRGDLQAMPYLLPKVKNAAKEKIDNPMTALGRYKILDNLLRAATPLLSVLSLLLIGCFAPTRAPLSFLFLFSHILFPIVYSFATMVFYGNFAIALRRFRSRAMPQVSSTFVYSFYKICAMAQEAGIFADALIRTIYRFAVSKRNFLNWQTAAFADKQKNDIFSYMKKMWHSFAFGVIAVFAPSVTIKLLGILWLTFPFLAHSISQKSPYKHELGAKQRKEIYSHASRMWGFYRDLVNEETNFLPPDNYQVSPVERTAYRTSPTNIGLYLASLLGARDISLITCDEFEYYAEKTAMTLMKLPTWKGHLYNWYDIKTLEVIGEPFISTVDSGNFVCALSSFCEGAKEYAFECPKILDVIRVYEGIIKRTEFSALYDDGARLFHIGYDARNERYSDSFYDTFMSEARMTSFYAVATGQVPREHFFATARPIVSTRGYIGVASWSGTTFEYFMPSLFLPIIPDSLSDEALCFAFRTEKAHSIKCNGYDIFGVSESGYWQFDAEMNYQYKAFGLSHLSLDPNGRNSAVISPYSSFLMLGYGAEACLDNLRALKKLGAYGEYGFYEAIDLEKSRVGNGYGIVKSYMAHHIGMSFVSCVNMLKDDIFVRRFMRTPKLRASRELLCEKISVNAPTVPMKAKNKHEEKPLLVYHDDVGEISARYDILCPDMAMISNNKTRILASSSGHMAIYNGEKVLFRSDFERFSLGGGLQIYAVADGETLPLVPLAQRNKLFSSRFSFKYNEYKISYISEHEKDGKTISAELHLRVFSDREMVAFWCKLSGNVKSAHTFIYGEPIMDEEKSFISHKSFANLFLESRYAAEEETLVFSRRSKHGGESKNFFGIKAYPDVKGGSFDTKRDEILPLLYDERDIMSLASKGGSQNTLGAMIIPALAMHSAEMDKKGICAFVIACSQNEDDTRYMLSDLGRHLAVLRKSDVAHLQYGASGISPKTAMIENYILRSFYFGSKSDGLPYPKATKDILWKHGISGEDRLLLVSMKKADESELDALKLCIGVYKYMCIRGQRFDLVVMYSESDLYNLSNRKKIEQCIAEKGCRNFIGRENGIFLISDNAVSAQEEAVFEKISSAKIELCLPISSYLTKNSSTIELSQKAQEKLLSKAKKTVSLSANLAADGKCGYFTDDGFIVKKPHGNVPFAYILAERDFGTVITENSLGFTYFENSALGKLTPHTADNMREDGGEKLLLRIYDSFDKSIFEDIDLAACAETVRFSEGEAEYFGEAGGIKYSLHIGIYADAPIKRVSFNIIESDIMHDRIKLIFVVEPCLGERKRAANEYIFERYGESIMMSSVFEGNISAIMATSHENKAFLSRAELLSDGNISFIGEDVACLCVTPKGDDEEISFFIGAVSEKYTHEDIMSRCESRPVKRRLCDLFDKIKIKTSEPVFDISVNFLFPYQTLYSRFFARSGFYQVGGAYGFRDQLQDSLSFIENAPKLCRAQILRCVAHQYKEGDVAHWWHEYRGKETGLRSRYADDLLWLPYVVCEYIEKTGDVDLLNVKVPFLSSKELDVREKERYEELFFDGEATVFEHMMRAVHLVRKRGAGEHSLLLFGGGDWNDGMNNVGILGKGESVWLTEFCAIVYLRLARLCERLRYEEDARFFAENAKKLYDAVKLAFKDGWFLRGYYDDGTPLGKKGDEECEIDSLSQSFAVFMERMFENGKCDGEATMAIEKAYEKLYDKELGFWRLLSPPFDRGEARPGYIKGYLPGVRENGGQYTHAAVWASAALLMSGKVDEGIDVLMALDPAIMSKDASFSERYKIEPYALAGDVYSHAECSGRGGWSFYTGAAAWYRKTIIEIVFGYAQSESGFCIRPHINEKFDNAKLSVNVKGTEYTVCYAFTEKSGIVLDGRIAETDEERMKNFIFKFDGKKHIVDYCLKKREK